MTSVLPARQDAIAAPPGALDVQAIRKHFTFPKLGRIVTNNAASTQPPRELLALQESLAPGYENVLYAKEHLLAASLPFLYGGDMISEGRVFPWQVEYNALPWKYAAGTPNILGAVVSAQAIRVLLDLALTPGRPFYFGRTRPLERFTVHLAMDRVCAWNQALTSRALNGLSAIDGITIYGPRDPARRTSLVAFNLAGRDPVRVAEALNEAGWSRGQGVTARPSPTTPSG